MPGGRTVEYFQSSDLTQRYDLIQNLTNEFAVETLCQVLGVSRTAYYRYQRGQTYQLTPKKEANKALVERVFREHKRRYGSRRIVSQLQDEGHQLGRQQVRTLMKVADLQSIQPKSFVPRTTDSTHNKGYCGAARAAESIVGLAVSNGP